MVLHLRQFCCFCQIGTRLQIVLARLECLLVAGTGCAWRLCGHPLPVEQVGQAVRVQTLKASR